jgi:hypothetical protein
MATESSDAGISAKPHLKETGLGTKETQQQEIEKLNILL